MSLSKRQNSEEPALSSFKDTSTAAEGPITISTRYVVTFAVGRGIHCLFARSKIETALKKTSMSNSNYEHLMKDLEVCFIRI